MKWKTDTLELKPIPYNQNRTEIITFRKYEQCIHCSMCVCLFERFAVCLRENFTEKKKKNKKK